MNIRNLLNLVLLAIVAILVAVVIYEPGQQQVPVQTLSTLTSNTITRIMIERQGLQTIQLEKHESNWMMTQPYNAIANQYRVDALLALPEAKVRTSFTAADHQLSNYALASAKATIVLNDEVFKFGSVEHISKHRYILHKGNISLTTDRFYHHLRTSAGQFVSPALLPTDKKIVGLDLPRLKLARNAKDGWDVTPPSATTSADQANTLISNWQTAKALFVNEHDGSKSDKHVVVRFDDNTSIEFAVFVSGDKTSFVRQDSGLKYLFYADKTKSLLQLPTIPATPNVTNEPASTPQPSQ